MPCGEQVDEDSQIYRPKSSERTSAKSFRCLGADFATSNHSGYM